MRSANNSSNALQQNVHTHSSSSNSSPLSKTTAHSFKSLFDPKATIKSGTVSRNMKRYSKINASRTNLLLLASKDVSLKSNYFDLEDMNNNYIIRQELDIYSNTSLQNGHLNYNENEHSYIDYSSPGTKQITSFSPLKSTEKRRGSSKYLCYELFIRKRLSHVLSFDTSLEVKKPFYLKLCNLASSLKSKEFQRTTLNKLDDLTLLTKMIASKEEKLKHDQAHPSIIKNSALKKNIVLSNKIMSFKQSTESSLHFDRKFKRGSLSQTNVHDRKVTTLTSSCSNKENAIVSNLLVLIPCGINQSSSESDHSD